jgi:hypothetical protein
MYNSTAVRGLQENVAIEDGGSWFSLKKGTQTCTNENIVKNHWAHAGGDIEESRSPKPPTPGEWLKSKA